MWEKQPLNLFKAKPVHVEDRDHTRHSGILADCDEAGILLKASESEEHKFIPWHNVGKISLQRGVEGIVKKTPHVPIERE